MVEVRWISGALVRNYRPDAADFDLFGFYPVTFADDGNPTVTVQVQRDKPLFVNMPRTVYEGLPKGQYLTE